mmetsp:Transcript_18461/g.26047  ORF Transcript_18461/g.26047 Transcript_18461/m.26047 type:complete len:231 (-) Transcript_18461:40-732(-)
METPNSAEVATDASKNASPTTTTKIDEITAIQDSIDGLSLSMFEALRKLRDAVAPESGNIGFGQQVVTTAQQQQDTEDSFEEFCQAYKNGDMETLEKVRLATGTASTTTTTTTITTKLTKKELRLVFAKLEMEKDAKDAELAGTLASEVLEKSNQVNRRVDDLKGMDRTKAEQMIRIQQLLQENQQVSNELQQAYDLALERRNQVRTALKEQTCQALGIEEEEIMTSTTC